MLNLLNSYVISSFFQMVFWSHPAFLYIQVCLSTARKLSKAMNELSRAELHACQAWIITQEIVHKSLKKMKKTATPLIVMYLVLAMSKHAKGRRLCMYANAAYHLCLISQ